MTTIYSNFIKLSKYFGFYNQLGKEVTVRNKDLSYYTLLLFIREQNSRSKVSSFCVSFVFVCLFGVFFVGYIIFSLFT